MIETEQSVEDEIEVSLPARLEVDFRVEYSNDVLIDSADRAAAKMQRDLMDVAESLRLEASDQLDAYYCVDFDVIRSSIDWLDEKSTSSLWSALSINFSPSKIVFLPGSLFETLRFLEKQSVKISQQEASAYTQYFSSADDPYRVVFARNKGAFAPALDAFRRSVVSPKSLYMLRVLKENLASSDLHDFKEHDQQMFEQACDILSVGARSGQWINNRVDALNYSLVHRLNQDIAETRRKYYLVSNAGSMKKLGDALSAAVGLSAASSFFSGGMTVNASFAAIHQILIKAGGGAAGAERIAHDLTFDLANYRSKLHRFKKDRDLSRMPVEQATAVLRQELNSMLQSFGVLQRQVGRFKSMHQKRLEFLGSSYEPNDPAKFIKEISGHVDTVLLRSGYLPQIEALTRRDLKLQLFEVGPRPPFTFETSFEMRLDDTEKAAFARLYRDHVAFFAVSNAPINEFVRTAQLVHGSINANLSKGRYRPSGREGEFAASMGLLSGEVVELSEEELSEWKIDKVAKQRGLLVEEICFLRFDFDGIALSFEGDLLAFRCEAPHLVDEAVLFLEELVETKFRSLGIREQVSNVLLRWERSSKFGVRGVN